ncbi:MAG: phosphomannomutase/phosphoglucomutase [Planctomycetota bacterium]|nr:phosphomannomutase/phosphoglucomutase [Planctomycetota bacterium]
MSIFKAYDIRGIYPSELDDKLARKIGWAAARFLKAKTLVVGRDVRVSSEAVAMAAVEGARAAGADIVDIGVVTTPMCYYATGKLEVDGSLMVTASHNPREYNGFKMCREKAIPLSEDTGIRDIEKLCAGDIVPAAKKGAIRKVDISAEYVRHVAGFAGDIRALTVCVDTANGSAGIFFPGLAATLPIKVLPLFFQPDGSFPNHGPNPMKDENTEALQNLILNEKADLGVAFDGDADRCIFFDELGHRVPSDLVTALLAREALARESKGVVVYDLRSSDVVREEIERAGGVAVRNRVGHAFIKNVMRRHNAVLGGELSGHFYFRDNYYADSGFLALLKMLNIISSEGRTLSALLKPLQRYHATGEINFHVDDPDKRIEALARAFADGTQDRMDGITVRYGDWWFNVRKSNTEPILRLNLEARTADTMTRMRRRVEDVIAGT